MQFHFRLALLLLPFGFFVLQYECFAQSQNQAAVLRGEGAFLRGLGSYNLNTSIANSVNTDTVIRWKQDLRKIEAERRDLLARKEVGKKLKIEDVKRRQQARERELRVSPNSDDIQNGAALNALLYDLTDPAITSSDWSSKSVPLPKEMSVKDLIFRFTPSSGSSGASKALSRGVIALSRLDVEGKMWPTVMRQDELDNERLGFEESYAKLRDQLVNDEFNHKALAELDRSLDALKTKAETAVPKERGFRDEALKYVSDLKDATRMFDAATVDYSREILIDTKDHDATTVGELVGFMLKYRLQFASAERSASGRVLYGQIYEVMRQQANAFGIKPPDELAIKKEIPKNVAENIQRLRAHRPGINGGGNPAFDMKALPTKLDAIVDAAKTNDTEKFDSALNSVIEYVEAIIINNTGKTINKTGKTNYEEGKADILAVLYAIKNGQSDLRNIPIYDKNGGVRIGLP